MDNNSIALDLIDYYIDLYTKRGHKDTARKFKELKEDVHNALIAKNNNEHIRLIRKLGSDKAVWLDEDNPEYRDMLTCTNLGEIFEVWTVAPVYDKGNNAIYQRAVLTEVTAYESDIINIEYHFYGQIAEGYISKEDVENAIAFKE